MTADMKQFDIANFPTEKVEKIISKEIFSLYGVKMGGNEP